MLTSLNLILKAGCPAGSDDLLPTTDCAGFYYCVSGSASGIFQCSTGTLFDASIQACNWKDSFTCECSSTSPSPTATATSAVADEDLCRPCPSSDWDMVGSSDCTGFYHCISGSASNFVSCPSGTIWSASTQGCDWSWRTECTCE